jgi:hypothetical protein
MTFRRVRIPARGGDRGLILKGLFIMFLSNFKEKSSFLRFILVHLHLRILAFCIFCRLGVPAAMPLPPRAHSSAWRGPRADSEGFIYHVFTKI